MHNTKITSALMSAVVLQSHDKVITGPRRGKQGLTTLTMLTG